MFTYRVRIQLNPGSFTELSRKIQNEIMPALRLREGFRAGITFIDTFSCEEIKSAAANASSSVIYPAVVYQSGG